MSKLAFVILGGLVANVAFAKDCREAAAGAAAQMELMQKSARGKAVPGETKSVGKKDGIETFSVIVTNGSGEVHTYLVKVDAQCGVTEEPTPVKDKHAGDGGDDASSEAL